VKAASLAGWSCGGVALSLRWTGFGTPSTSAPLEGQSSMRRPWEKHFRMAIVLLAVGFAVAEFWNLMAGSALAAAALFVALRPLFLKRGPLPALR
jgi:hypothetical protein